MFRLFFIIDISLFDENCFDIFYIDVLSFGQINSIQFAFVFDYLSRSKNCIQTRLSRGYSRCLLSGFLVYQLCTITGSTSVDYEQVVSIQSFWIYNCCSLQFYSGFIKFCFLRMTRFTRIFGSKMIKKLLFSLLTGGLCAER